MGLAGSVFVWRCCGEAGVGVMIGIGASGEAVVEFGAGVAVGTTVEVGSSLAELTRPGRPSGGDVIAAVASGIADTSVLSPTGLLDRFPRLVTMLKPVAA